MSATIVSEDAAADPKVPGHDEVEANLAGVKVVAGFSDLDFAEVVGADKTAVVYADMAFVLFCSIPMYLFEDQ